MSEQKIGKILAGTYERELGSSIAAADDGTITIQESWVMNTTDVAILSPVIKQPFPNQSGARVTGVTSTLIGAGLSRVTITGKSVVGVSGSISIGGSDGFFSLSTISFDNPLPTHPDVDAIKTAAGAGWIEDDTGLFEGITTESSDPQLVGVSSYKSGTLAWTRRWSTNSKLSSRYLDELHKISEPDGNPPNLSSPRNWLLDSISSDENGDGWTHSATWIASEVGKGWATAIYEP